MTNADRRPTTGLAYFERMYEVPDPWGYETSWYEQRKYALTVAALPRSRYERTFESAVAALPASSIWTDPSRSRPIDHVRAVLAKSGSATRQVLLSRIAGS